MRFVSGEDGTRGKPDPEPYLLACRKAKVNPGEALVVENAPLGVRSAVDAGCKCLAINTDKLESKLLLNEGAEKVFDSFSQLKSFLHL